MQQVMIYSYMYYIKASNENAKIKGQPSSVRDEEWTEPKNEHSNKRPHSRQFHAASGNAFSVDLQNSSVELENQINRQGSQSPYQIPSSVYEGDPGVMSEVETSATGFRRPSKGRSPIPASRPPLKSQERAI
ncbi:coiled-coil domain-containing protein CG32809-like, partial [Limulus polyphemus]|uniref:Coiled-coil domain-containing protein CG32809-like n=1 Tax=Limulus polyphemus TaxID=6850 RepID=A0ABM1TLK8_LIMPO